jgi:rod shape-determining protein MreD
VYGDGNGHGDGNGNGNGNGDDNGCVLSAVCRSRSLCLTLITHHSSLITGRTMLSWRRFIPVLAVLFLLQTAFVCRYAFGAFRVDLLCLLAVFVALEADYAPALTAAFIIGLTRDLGSGGPLGMGPLLFVPVAAGIVVLRKLLLRESFATDMVLAGVAVLAVGMIDAVLTTLGTPAALFGPLAARACGQAAMSMALWPLLHLALAACKLIGEPLEQYRHD